MSENLRVIEANPNGLRVDVYQYEYRALNGELFTCVISTLERARESRDKWLAEKPERNAEQEKPKYANRYGYSDVEPYEIVRWVSETCIEIRFMNTVLSPDWKPNWVPGGFSAICTNISEQKWIITSNPANPVTRIHKGKKGWKQGEFRLSHEPVKYYDYNF